MNRDEFLIQKVINKKIEESSDKTDQIIKAFKRLHFDMKRSKEKQEVFDYDRSRFYQLTRETFIKLVNISFFRFTGSKGDSNEDLMIKDINSLEISIESDLKLLLKSCGNILSDEEIELMLHFIDSEKVFDSKVISLEQLKDIWGAVIYFSKIPLDELIWFVFKAYFAQREELGQNNEKKEIELDVEGVR